MRPVRLGRTADVASSAVFATGEGVFLHGDEAERRGAADPARLLRGYRRRIGDDVPLLVAGRAVTGEDLFARTVAWAVITAAAGRPLDGLVVTVPASWGAHRRDLVRRALAARDLPPATLLSEPEAVASRYAAQRGWTPGAVLAVYDLGAGSCDLAFVRLGAAPGETAVLHAAAVTDLGGSDFDDAVLAHVLASADPALAAGAPSEHAALRRACIAAKEALSTEAAAVVAVGDTGSTVRIVRSEFETMIEGDIARTVDAFAAARTAAGLAPGDVAALLLAGGSTRIPRVAQLLSQELELPVWTDADPQAVVACGAAQAQADADAAVEPGAAQADADGAVEPGAAREPAALTAHVAPPRLAAAMVAARPRRWRTAMTGTAAAATLVGGLALGSSVAAVAADVGPVPASGPTVTWLSASPVYAPTPVSTTAG